MSDLFSYKPSYPHSPGWRDPDTSRAAADSMKPTAKVLQGRCLAALRINPMTADETAEYLGESLLSIRPRFTELQHAGKIIDSGLRRKNASGRNAKVFRLV